VKKLRANNRLHILFGGIVIVVLVFILGMALGRHESSIESEVIQRENEKLRKELLRKITEVINLRNINAANRKLLEKEIEKSVFRYDSLEKVSRARQAKLLLEIRKLKTSTVKELEDEAERIYNSVVDNH
jgi:Tfp pilus assembly protein PilO